MKLVGLMPVRNEDWCLGLSARVALMWCDELVLLLHECTDNSLQIVADIRREATDRISYFRIDGPWDEMRHRQMMLQAARDEHQATHIAIIDADEVLTGTLLVDNIQYARDSVKALRANQILSLPGYNLRGSLDRYHSSGVWGNRWFSVAFADDLRLCWQGDKFHSREPVGAPLQSYRPIQQGQGGVMHLWGVSERRLRAKHALYKITERLRWPKKDPTAIDELYSMAIYGLPLDRDSPERWKFTDVPAAWWAPYAHLMKYLDVDKTPWQEEECRRLIKEHGASRFKGLDLFGVV